MSLEKTLSRLEARARSKSVRPDPAKELAARHEIELRRLTAARWEALKARYAGLPREEKVTETRARLSAAHAAYQQALSEQRSADPVKVWLAAPGLAHFSVRALEIQLAALEGAPEADVAGMAARAGELVRSDAWQATAHLDVLADWAAHRPTTPVAPSAEGLTPQSIPATPGAPPTRDPPAGEEIETPSFEPGDWN